jgi:hypothetical protein
MLLCTTSDDEMTKQNKKSLHLKTLLFQIYIGFKLYKIPPNYHPRGDLISHPCFKFNENLEAIRVDKH